MLNRIPRCKTKNLIPQPHIKVIKNQNNDENFKHKVSQRKLKFSELNRQFGKDLTNMLTNNFQNNNSINKNNKKGITNVYIKKNSSASQILQKTKIILPGNYQNSFEKKVNENLSGGVMKKRNNSSFSIASHNNGNLNEVYNTKKFSNNMVSSLHRNSFGLKNKNSGSYYSGLGSSSGVIGLKISGCKPQVSGTTTANLTSKITLSNKEIIDRIKSQEVSLKNSITNKGSFNINHKSNLNNSDNEGNIVSSFIIEDPFGINNKENINNNLHINVNKSHHDFTKEINLLKSVNIADKENEKAKDKEKKELSPIVIKTNNQEPAPLNPLNITQKEEKEEDDIHEESPIIYFDVKDVHNIQIPREYINIIYYNLLKEEEQGIEPKADYHYMAKQKEVNEQMRSILVDWIIDVHHKFGFTDETLFMTVSIIDRFLTIVQVTRTRLQLLGITALMIACKHEEIDLPKVDDFIYITDNAYTRNEVFDMENEILNKFHFNLLYPSPIKFFEYLSLHFKFDKKNHYMGKYLMESFLISLKNIKYKPSIISCACTYIVMKFFKLPDYHETYNRKFYVFEHEKNNDINLNEHKIKECAKDICQFVDNIHKTNYLACQKKYSKSEFEKVSILIVGKK